MISAVLRLPTVMARVGLSRSGIYLAIAEGKFPKPIKLGTRAVGWLESEVDAWLCQQVERSRPTQKGVPAGKADRAVAESLRPELAELR